MRYHIIDNIRGLTFISMAAFHTVYDLVYMFGIDLAWFKGPLGYIWQQSILWTFILLSGFCCGLSHHQFKRGGIVFAAGLLVTAVTVIVMPDEAVFFGVLSFLGAAMIAIGVTKPMLERLRPTPALIVCIALFVITRDVPFGFLGFEQLRIIELPDALYANWLTTAFGFQFGGFSSSDYVPFLPWIFLYLTGFFGCRALPRKSGSGREDARPILALPQQRPWPVANFIGRHCLGFYLAHQVVIYAALSAIFALVS